ncbi:MAG: AAA family ATPase [Pseudomonadota bacterium]|nr:AAA family ATPase [Gammaproteobacteria bacterium]MBU1926934.1 AAA family ATPase [Gammaproteobacteria bacterium]
MYLAHFKFDAHPFTLTPNTKFFCDLPTYQEALNTILMSLAQGEGFIKIVGEVGSGKTLLCRLLLDRLQGNTVSAYLPNPDLNGREIYKALASELGLSFPEDADKAQLMRLVNAELISLYQAGKRVVLIVDEAQVLSFESYETIRLLSNIETESDKLLQIVLFGQPELDVQLNQPRLRQLKQRITFSYHLRPLSRDELDAYLSHRLSTAGYTWGDLFSKSARSLLYKSSQGIPRLINILAHKALLSAYGRKKTAVKVKEMKLAIRDTDSAAQPFWEWGDRLLFWGFNIIVALLVVLSIEIYFSVGR